MVQQAFGVKYDWNNDDLLAAWKKQATTIEIDDFAAKMLSTICYKAKLYGRNLNEQELRDKIIAPLLHLVNFDDYELAISAFSERSLRIVFQDTIIEEIVQKKKI